MPSERGTQSLPRNEMNILTPATIQHVEKPILLSPPQQTFTAADKKIDQTQPSISEKRYTDIQQAPDSRQVRILL